MRRTTIVITALTLLGGLSAGVLGLSQPEKAPPPQGPPKEHPAVPADMQAAMEAWSKAMAPSAQHEVLKKMVGEWKTTTRLMGGGAVADAPGTASNELVLGGRFLLQRTTGTMMEQPVSGLGMLGYDIIRKQFTGTWADTMGTGLLHYHGGLNKDGDGLTMFGAMDEPMTGEIGKTIRLATRFDGPDRYTLTIQEVQYGEPFTVVEITYERAK
ncbi:MAG: DUF1579 domain-containing protein [Phycisphaerales bacterium]